MRITYRSSLEILMKMCNAHRPVLYVLHKGEVEVFRTKYTEFSGSKQSNLESGILYAEGITFIYDKIF